MRHQLCVILVCGATCIMAAHGAAEPTPAPRVAADRGPLPHLRSSNRALRARAEVRLQARSEVFTRQGLGFAPQGPSRWVLAFRSPLLPYLRLYRGQGSRYPSAMLVDLWEMKKVTSFGANTLQELVRRNGMFIEESNAKAAVEAYLRFRLTTFPPSKLAISIKKRRGLFRFEASYQRSAYGPPPCSRCAPSAVTNSYQLSGLLLRSGKLLTAGERRAKAP